MRGKGLVFVARFWPFCQRSAMAYLQSRRNKLFVLLTLCAALFASSTLVGQADFTEITVQKGETLSVIAKKHLDDPRRWRELLKYNNVPKPDLIFPGMTLKIPAFLARQPIARVDYTRVVAEHHKADGSSWAPARLDLTLFSNDQVRTRDAGLLRLQIKDGLLTLGANTILVLNREQIEEQSSTQIMLRRGRLHTLFDKQKQNRATRLQIVTPAAVASVRGTEFTTDVDESENTTVGCLEGAVGVSAAGKTIEVPAGYGTFVKKGQPPSELFRLPAQPRIDVNE